MDLRLHHAVSRGDYIEVNRLITREKVYVTLRDSDDVTALHLAAKSPHVDILRLLLHYGARPNAVDALGQTPLVEAIVHGRVQNVMALLPHTFNLTQQFGCGKVTLLHIAVIFKRIEIIEILITNGMDVNILDGEGSTPLHFAIEEEDVQITRTLLDHGADAYIKNRRGQTCMELQLSEDIRELLTFYTSIPVKEPDCI